jgi:VIT1/CCC1 family predicted Fe2+/Mn2+ transporter
MFGALLTVTGFVFSQLRGIISVGAVIMTLGVGFMAVAKRSGLD